MTVDVCPLLLLQTEVCWMADMKLLLISCFLAEVKLLLCFSLSENIERKKHFALLSFSGHFLSAIKWMFKATWRNFCTLKISQSRRWHSDLWQAEQLQCDMFTSTHNIVMMSQVLLEYSIRLTNRDLGFVLTAVWKLVNLFFVFPKTIKHSDFVMCRHVCWQKVCISTSNRKKHPQGFFSALYSC